MMTKQPQKMSSKCHSESTINYFGTVYIGSWQGDNVDFKLMETSDLMLYVLFALALDIFALFRKQL